MFVNATSRSAPSIPASLRDGIEPSESPIAQNTSTAAVAEAASTATNVAPHTAGPIAAGAGAIACSVIVASAAVRPNWARLKSSRTGLWPRVQTSTTAGPTIIASTRSCGAASSRPSTSGSSDSDSECALPRTCAWITNSSVAAKPAASAHHGIRTSVPYGTRSRTTWCHNTNAATAVAAISAPSVTRVSRPSCRSTKLQTSDGRTSAGRTSGDPTTRRRPPRTRGCHAAHGPARGGR